MLEGLTGSLLDIRSVLLEAKIKTLRYRHTMRNSESGRDVATIDLLIPFIDKQARKFVPLAEDVRAKAAAILRAKAARTSNPQRPGRALAME